MKMSWKNGPAICLGLLLAGTLGVVAGETAKDTNPPKTYELNDGSKFENPGEMFQHLRDRDIDGFASGNPKDIVDAYPEEFENVGDLIEQKRVD